jgi:hypothetical protein
VNDADSGVESTWRVFGSSIALDDIESTGGAGSGAVLPSQIQVPPDWRQAASGEIALRQAILEDAITCFQKQFSSKGQMARRLGREAESWIFRDERRWPFSFVAVCEALGIEPRAVRRWLARWVAREAKPRLRRSHMVLSRAGRRRRRAAA